MYTKDTHTQLAIAFLTGLLLFGTTIAVVNPGQYSRFQTQSYYSPTLSSYGNEHENYFDIAGELSSDGGYSNEPYKHQQYPPTGYSSTGSGFADAANEPPSNQRLRSERVHQLHPDYQDSVSEHYSAFGQSQNSEPDNFHPPYSDDTVASSPVSFYNIDFNNSEAVRYHAATEDIMYPPQQHTRTHQQRQQQQAPTTQHYALSTDYTTTNNNAPPPRAHSPSYPHDDKDRRTGTVSASNLAGSAAVAELTVTTGRLPPPPPSKSKQTHARNQMPYVESENQHRDQYHFPRTSEYLQLQPESSKSHERLSNGSSSRTYYVADSDQSASTSNHLDTESLSVLQSHLVQLPAVSSQSHGSASLPNYGIPSEPIPISKHVEITKHIPVPVFRQVHVPYRKPVRIEIPRSVITTVPRPYPIHIPSIMKPITLPTVREIKIPIEKVRPYPVEHKVPYIVEKRVPFQIEKQVASPVYYPFPVRVPMVRTIVHKKNSHLPLFQYRSRIHM